MGLRERTWRLTLLIAIALLNNRNSTRLLLLWLLLCVILLLLLRQNWSLLLIGRDLLLLLWIVVVWCHLVHVGHLLRISALVVVCVYLMLGHLVVVSGLLSSIVVWAGSVCLRLSVLDNLLALVLIFGWIHSTSKKNLNITTKYISDGSTFSLLIN